MEIVLWYVNSKGSVIERFLIIFHVSDTTASSLKKAIESLFSTYSLSISSICGQGYDGANNMKGEYNGQRTLIMKIIVMLIISIVLPSTPIDSCGGCKET